MIAVNASLNFIASSRSNSVTLNSVINFYELTPSVSHVSQKTTVVKTDSFCNLSQSRQLSALGLEAIRYSRFLTLFLAVSRISLAFHRVKTDKTCIMLQTFATCISFLTWLQLHFLRTVTVFALSLGSHRRRMTQANPPASRRWAHRYGLRKSLPCERHSRICDLDF